MEIDNIDKTRKKINLELEGRLAENKKNYYFQLSSFKSNLSIKEHYVSDGNSSTSLDDVYDLGNKSETIFTSINRKVIGKMKFDNDKQLKTINGIKINYNKFKDCIFANVRFKNCTFYGTVFSSCTFKDVAFENCYFSKSVKDIVVFNDKSTFINSYFKNCNIENSIFKDVDIKDTKFILSSLKNTILSDVDIKNIHVSDCDWRSLKIMNPKIETLEFEDNFLTKFNEDTFLDKIKINKKNKKSYEYAFKVYRDVSRKFEANGLLNSSGQYYYLSKLMEQKLLKGIEKIKSYIFWMLCGYGERPTYALITSIEVVLFFTITYMFTGLNVEGYSINYKILFISGLPIESLISDFMKSLYFSIVTFTTVGYGDITPVGYSVLLSGLEMFLGVTMVGVWTATLARKITR